MHSVEIWYHCTLVTLEENYLKEVILTGTKLTLLPALSAHFQAVICNQLQEQEGTGEGRELNT